MPRKLEKVFELPQFQPRAILNSFKKKGLTKLPLQFFIKDNKLYAHVSTLYDLHIINEVITDYLKHTGTKNPNILQNHPARMTINWRYNTLKFH